MLLNRLGLSPDSPQLRILASSASLEVTGTKRNESLKFLKDFFGTEFTADNVVEGHYMQTVQSYNSVLPTEPFVRIYDLFYENPSCFEEYQTKAEIKNRVDEVCSNVALSLATYAHCELPDTDGLAQCSMSLHPMNCP